MCISQSASVTKYKGLALFISYQYTVSMIAPTILLETNTRLAKQTLLELRKLLHKVSVREALGVRADVEQEIKVQLDIVLTKGNAKNLHKTLTYSTDA